MNIQQDGSLVIQKEELEKLCKYFKDSLILAGVDPEPEITKVIESFYRYLDITDGKLAKDKEVITNYKFLYDRAINGFFTSVKGFNFL